MNGKSSATDVLYSKEDNKRVNNLLKLHLSFMTVGGLRPYVLEEWFPRKLRGLGRFLSYLYSGFIVIQTLLTALQFAKKAFDMFQQGDLNSAIDASVQICVSSFGVFSSTYWLWQSNNLRKFAASLNRNYWHHSLAGLTHISFFEAYMKARRFGLIWFVLSLSGACLWGLAPLLQGSYTLPLNCWYPFDPLQPSVYPFVYMFQMMTQINFGICIGGSSALFGSLTLLLLGQYDVLFCSLKNLQYHAQLLCGESLDTMRQRQLNLRSTEDEEELNQYMLSHEHLTDLTIFRQLPENHASQKRHLQSALNESLAKCVKFHRFVCECCKTMEDIYNPYCLMKSLVPSIQICLLVFGGVAGERSMVRLFNIFQYVILTLLEFSLFTYCAELLYLHSVRSSDAFARSNWESYATLIRKDIVIFLINSQRPMRLTAGKFFTMGTDRLRLVILQSFSFLTLLQNLVAKNK